MIINDVSNQASNRINQAPLPGSNGQSQNPNVAVINLDGNLVTNVADSLKHEVKESEMFQTMDKLSDDSDIFKQE